MAKHAARVAGKQKQALRQTGSFEWHPDECGCRKCRRMRAALTRRAVPRYGQTDRAPGPEGG
jgi:hypothetical protein